MTRKAKLVLRWSLVTSVLIALFWLIYYLTTGNMPMVQIIKISKGLSLTLPLAIPRYLDFLLGPIYSAILILLATSLKMEDKNNLEDGLVLGALISMLVGLIGGSGFGLLGGSGFGLLGGMMAGLLFCIDINSDFGLSLVLGVSLGLGLISNMASGLINVVAFGLGIVMGVILILTLGFINKIFLKPFCDWLKVKEG